MSVQVLCSHKCSPCIYYVLIYANHVVIMDSYMLKMYLLWTHTGSTSIDDVLVYAHIVFIMHYYMLITDALCTTMLNMY